MEKDISCCWECEYFVAERDEPNWCSYYGIDVDEDTPACYGSEIDD